MKLLARKLSEFSIGWNERPCDEAAFFALCDRFSVKVSEEPLATSGFYYRLLEDDFIVVNSRLAGVERLFVLLHELGHFLLHVPRSGPTASFFEIDRSLRKEREADVFALCALVPTHVVDSRGYDGLVHDGFPHDLVERRLKIRKRFGL